MIREAIITGATGEIGYALVRLLLAEGIRVSVLIRPDSKRRRYLPVSPLLKIIPCDLSELRTLPAENCGSGDAFFHLGWIGSYGPQASDICIQTQNIQFSLDALDLAERTGCRVFVGAGSQAQYGRLETKITPKSPMHPISAYGIAKKKAEEETLLASRPKGIRHVWGRILSVYGPCDGPYTLITYLMTSLLRGNPVRLTACRQIWDFLFSEDAAKAFFLLAEKGIDGKGYCLASGKEQALSEYIEVIRRCFSEFCSPEIRIGEKPYAENQCMYLGADIRNLKADTGFIPATSFENGIRKTILWYRKNQENGFYV